ncbi:hypothetical protein KOI35_15595 [Actinoplanes bogorensis]|uniref:Integral membrane protein n=1 Tax=Paractinoplanes bogorensis TaxID=1610840 RepID=A0ABS5YPD7_9ACTN|nr:hypothetical protein [Actinoplanes bogorensis]MBU2664926.1 hypothetical protein [Actinoplanes bogorensis]
MTGWLTLYARSRRVPVAAAVSFAALALAWTGWSVFTDRPRLEPAFALLTILLALAPMIPTLAGDDDALESSAARPWPPRRALHLLTAGLIVAVPAVASAATGASFGPPAETLRNVAGLTGLIGLGVALAGTRMAWQLPICWTVAQLIFAGGDRAKWFFWLVEPTSSRVATATAAVLFVAGMLAYAWRVGPRLATAEAALGQ